MNSEVLAVGGVGEALGRILRLEPGCVPPCPPGHPDPAAHWRGWLGARGLGLVPVARPASFAWAGPWLVILGGAAAEQPGRPGSRTHADAGSDRWRAGVAFGVPAGLLWLDGEDVVDAAGPGAGRALDAAIAGFVVAPLVAADWAVLDPPGAPTAGSVVAIAIAAAAEQAARLVEAAQAQAGLGLVGDRYHASAGTFSRPGATGTALTLVDASVLAGIPAPVGPLDLPTSRRNIATSGIDLDALIGREFQIGEARCKGRRRAEPCAHLERLGPPGTLRALVHRAGLRADIIESGRIAVGDPILPLDLGPRPGDARAFWHGKTAPRVVLAWEHRGPGCSGMAKPRNAQIWHARTRRMRGVGMPERGGVERGVRVAGDGGF